MFRVVFPDELSFGETVLLGFLTVTEVVFSLMTFELRVVFLVGVVTVLPLPLVIEFCLSVAYRPVLVERLLLRLVRSSS